MSPQQPVYTRSEWMDGSDDALGPIGDIRDAVIQLDAGDWKGGAESALSAVQGIGELALGGLGGLISYGVDILLNYVDPLKFWMDQLTGDSAQVNGMAMTWASIGDSLRSTASELDSGSSSAMQNMKGESVSRYLSRQGQVVASINTLADASATVGSAVAKAAELVKKTHDYVCKLISDIIGEAVEGVAFAGLTLGASLVKAAVVVGERAIAEAWNVQNLLTLLKMAFDELKSLFDILTAAAPSARSARWVRNAVPPAVVAAVRALLRAATSRSAPPWTSPFASVRQRKKKRNTSSITSLTRSSSLSAQLRTSLSRSSSRSVTRSRRSSRIPKDTASPVPSHPRSTSPRRPWARSSRKRRTTVGRAHRARVMTGDRAVGRARPVASRSFASRVTGLD